MNKDLESILFTREEIAEKVKEIAAKIDDEYTGKNPLILCILKGSVIFTSDLIREMKCGAELDFLQISSYGSSAVSGEIKFKKDIDTDVNGRHVIVVEDILDTGRTLDAFINVIKKRNPASVKICTMFDKPARHVCDIKADFTGFVVDDHFLVGYGLDYAEKYRELPYVGILKREIYE